MCQCQCRRPGGDSGCLVWIAVALTVLTFCLCSDVNSINQKQAAEIEQLKAQLRECRATER